MDARPFRPRGIENQTSALHQRHKSTGNLTMAQMAATGALRGPAKRAAFGDVTNVSKSHATDRDGHKKIVKVQSVAHMGRSNTSAINKENVGNYKEGMQRPAQRPAGSGMKSKNAPEVRIMQARKPIERPATSEAPVRVFKGHVEAEERVQELPASTDNRMPNQRTSLDTALLQPRHHKSQPQLKQQQPLLRKTQSRYLDRIDLSHGGTTDPSRGSLDTLPEDDIAGEECEYLDSLQEQTDHESLAEVIHDEYMDARAELTEIGHEGPADVITATHKDGPTPGLSEPEEYWDEDDEEYDDQDQAYTTAHSVRSRDMTTGGATTVLQPRVTARVERELEEARLEVERTRTWDDIEEETWDVSMVAEYGDEIFSYMRDLEIKMLPNPHYMDIQTEIQWSMRAVLIDWLVQVHARFSLLPETLFLTVNYIDRFLGVKIVSIGKLQLVGATAILLASKYEEINCPSLQEIVYMVDKGYSGDEILKAERFMLSMLGFELGWPGPMSFLRRVSKADDYDLDTRTLAKYFLELTLMDERFVASPPSFLAAGAHCLSRLILGKGDWTKAHVHYSGYTWGQLKSLVSMMIGCCEHPRLHHSAIFEKYSERKFKAAALIVQDSLDAGFTLPQNSTPVRGSFTQASAYEEEGEQLQYQHSAIAIEG